MGEPTFDTPTRSLSTAGSRRRALAVTLAGVLVTLGLDLSAETLTAGARRWWRRMSGGG